MTDPALRQFVTEHATRLSAVAKGKLSSHDIAMTVLYIATAFRPEFETNREAFLQRALHTVARQAATTADDFEADYPGYEVHHDQIRLDKPATHTYLYNKWQQAIKQSDDVLETEAHLFA